MIGALSVGARSQQKPAGQTENPEQLRRAASTLYKIGWAEFGRGNIASAIEKYLESKRLFEEAHARRDLIYILADLGSLYIYSADYKTSKVYSEQIESHLRLITASTMGLASLGLKFSMIWPISAVHI